MSGGVGGGRGEGDCGVSATQIIPCGVLMLMKSSRTGKGPRGDSLRGRCAELAEDSSKQGRHCVGAGVSAVCERSGEQGLISFLFFLHGMRCRATWRASAVPEQCRSRDM